MADIELRHGIVGHDVGSLAAVPDDARHPCVRLHVSPKGIDVVERLDDAVKCVDALPGGAAGMGAFAVEFKPLGVQGVEAAAGPVLAEGMGHHGHCQVVVPSGSRQIHLAAQRLLGGRADDPHLAAVFVDGLPQGDAAANRQRADHIVSAGMSHALQRIVFRQKADSRPGLAALVGGDVCRLQIANVTLDGEAVFFQQRRHVGHRVEFLHAQLRVLVHLMGQSPDFRPQRLYPFVDTLHGIIPF